MFRPSGEIGAPVITAAKAALFRLPDIEVFFMGLDGVDEGVEHQCHESLPLGEVNNGGFRVTPAEKPDGRLARCLFLFPRDVDVGKLHVSGKAGRPLFELVFLLGRHIHAVDPVAFLVQVDLQDLIDLVTNRQASEFPRRADEPPRRGAQLVGEEGFPHLGDGDEKHESDEKDDDGKFDQRVTPAADGVTPVKPGRLEAGG